MVFNFEEKIKRLELTLQKDGEHVFYGNISIATLAVVDKAMEDSAKIKNIGNIQTMSVSQVGMKIKIFDTVFAENLKEIESLFDGEDKQAYINYLKTSAFDNLIEPELAKLKASTTGK